MFVNNYYKQPRKYKKMPEEVELKESTVVMGTRVPKWVEKEILDICQKDKRSVSFVIGSLLEEFLPVKKMILNNKQNLVDVSTTGSRHLELSRNEVIEDFITLRITSANGIDDDQSFDLELDNVKLLAANLFTFLLEHKLNG